MALIFWLIVATYFSLAITGYIFIWLVQDQWLPEFEDKMNDWKFRIIYFFYSPVAIIKRILGRWDIAD